MEKYLLLNDKQENINYLKASMFVRIYKMTYPNFMNKIHLNKIAFLYKINTTVKLG